MNRAQREGEKLFPMPHCERDIEKMISALNNLQERLKYAERRIEELEGRTDPHRLAGY